MMSDSQARKEIKQTDRVTYAKRLENTKNPVIFDSICKEIALRDKIFRRNWSKKYEFLTREFFQEILTDECKKAGIPEDTFKYKPRNDKMQCSPIPLQPSTNIPETTSGAVGFRSSRPECNLEFTGRMYISPKWTIEPPATPGEFRIMQQRFIFLG